MNERQIAWSRDSPLKVRNGHASREETKMRILERAKEWARAKWSGPTCYFCGQHETGKLGSALCQFEDVLMCRRCLSGPMSLVALDMLYWAKHPDEAPPCRHCGRVVAYQELWPLHDWYFCAECAFDGDVVLYWNRVHRRMMERRWAAHRLEVKKLGLGVWTP
jgi:hypothetical protein